MKLFSYLDYDDCTLMNDLQNKINNRLQNALSICSENFTSLIHLRIFLQDVNNKQRVNYQLRSQLRTVIVKVTVVSDKCVATSLSAVTTSIIEYVKSTIFSIFESVRSSIICYICKISDHLFKNCFQNKINTISYFRHASLDHLSRWLRESFPPPNLIRLAGPSAPRSIGHLPRTPTRCPLVQNFRWRRL